MNRVRRDYVVVRIDRIKLSLHWRHMSAVVSHYLFNNLFILTKKQAPYYKLRIARPL